jgi:hypothetical protein
MLVDLPLSDLWTSHLARRWNEAIEVGLRGPDAPLLRFEHARIFVPKGVDMAALEASHPQQSLRSLLKENPSPTSEWVGRKDLFREAAVWLQERFHSDPRAELYCEAGLSRVGDRSLLGRPHIVHEARPLLYLNIVATASKVIEDTLRRGRSPWRFLGVVVLSGRAPHQAPTVFPSESAMLFICDALDVDSLIVVSLDS